MYQCNSGHVNTTAVPANLLGPKPETSSIFPDLSPLDFSELIRAFQVVHANLHYVSNIKM